MRIRTKSLCENASELLILRDRDLVATIQFSEWIHSLNCIHLVGGECGIHRDMHSPVKKTLSFWHFVVTEVNHPPFFPDKYNYLLYVAAFPIRGLLCPLYLDHK